MRSITLTGVDERTSLNDIERLSWLGAEIGVLFTFSPDGRNRYPSLEWIRMFSSRFNGPKAIHVCGARARDEVYRGKHCHLIAAFDRMQVNGALSPRDLLALCRMFPRTEVITQHTERNKPLLAAGAKNHAVLMDGSGGRGRLPDFWTRPETEKRVGFAGGLGPTTLRNELPKIAAVAEGDWWVDMEGMLRDEDDWFDMELALAVMHIWIASLGLIAGDVHREDRP